MGTSPAAHRAPIGEMGDAGLFFKKGAPHYPKPLFSSCNSGDASHYWHKVVLHFFNVKTFLLQWPALQGTGICLEGDNVPDELHGCRLGKGGKGRPRGFALKGKINLSYSQ